MEEYFTCVRYNCTMQRKFCVERLLPKKRISDVVDTGCQTCEQGRQVAASVGVVIPDILAGFRVCNKCGEKKPVDAFYFHGKNQGSRMKTCKACGSRSASVYVDKAVSRKCTSCRQIKPLSEFEPSKSYMSGAKMRSCKECRDKAKKYHETRMLAIEADLNAEADIGIQEAI